LKKIARAKTKAVRAPTRVRAAAEQPDLMPEIEGIDHIYLAVSDFSRAEKFYDQVSARWNELEGFVDPLRRLPKKR